MKQKLKQQFQFLAWISWRWILSPSKSLFHGTAWISFAGLVVGVACLVVSMAVVSGFEQTLKTSVADVAGHLRIRKAGQNSEQWTELFEKLKKQEPLLQQSMEYAFMEGVLASKGRLSGVLMQGVDFSRVNQVLNLPKRLVVGEFLLDQGEKAKVLIGKGLAKQFALEPGQEFRIVFPLPSELDPTQFKRRVASFVVSGILDLGKKEFDDRLIIADLKVLQRLAQNSSSNGILVKMSDLDQAREVGLRLHRDLGSSFAISDWRDINENLFDAVKVERLAIFFVVFLIVLASTFNVSANLFINVIRRYPDLGVLKALGLTEKQIVRILSLQGLLLGLFGLLAGVFLGLLLCFVFEFMETHFELIPTSVYKIDHIDLSLRAWDLLGISVATLLICFVATWSPARRGAKLNPVEGLKHE